MKGWRAGTATIAAVVLLVGACGVAACGGDDDPAVDASRSSSPIDPTAPATSSSSGMATSDPPAATTGAEAPATSTPVAPTGFDSVSLTITEPDGTTCEVCAWLAATAEQRARGLMFVTDLGAAEAMLFQFDAPLTGEFWMRDTLIPLSIAFYDDALGYVSEADMVPCTAADPAACERYGASAPYRYAVEVAAGRLAALGFVPGSTMAIGELGCAG